MFNPDNFMLRWDLHQTTRASSIADIWRKQVFLDVTLVCDDEQVDAHKLVLSAASPLFQRILIRNEGQLGRTLLYLQGTKLKDIKILLEFIYDGEVEVQHEDLETFMKLADKLEIEGLKGRIDHEDDEHTAKQTKNTTNYLQAAIKETDISLDQKINLEDEVIEIPLLSDEKHLEYLADIETSKKITKKIMIMKKRNVKHEIVPAINQVEYDMEEGEIVANEDDSEKFGMKYGSEKDDEDYRNVKLELMTQSSSNSYNYNCKKCPYMGSKSHVLEHVEKHVEGFTFKCNLCDKSMRRKASLRLHTPKCKRAMSRTL